jgi:hypothetical protein
LKIDQNPSHQTREWGETDQQPSLPGAESVRELEHATPEFDLPFALTAPTAKDDGARARSLFDYADSDDAREARRLMGCE